MATQTDLQLLLTKGPLSSLWNKTNKVIMSTGTAVPATHEGQIYFGLDDDSKRIMLFYDHKKNNAANAERYVLTADVAWEDLRNVPTDLVHTPTIQALETTINNGLATKVSKTGDTMTGTLEIAASTTDRAPRVQLSYNNTTDSLDFTFA